MIKEIIQDIKTNRIIWLLSLYIIAMVIPPIPFSTPLYYGLLIVIFLFMASRRAMNLNLTLVLFYLAGGMSIAVNSPDDIFQSWMRLGLFIILTGGMSCLFESKYGYNLHAKILNATLWLCVAVSVGSFVCYFLGINYMQKMWGYGYESVESVGGFGGLTSHSMILGPLSAFSAIFLACKIQFIKTTNKTKYYQILLCIICLLSCLISASRSALACGILGILITIYCKHKGSIGKALGSLIVLAGLAAACYPLYSGYASGIVSKQQDNEDKGGTFSSRDEKWENRINEFRSSPIFGIGYGAIFLNTPEGQITKETKIVEPGSAWLSILSMTGILGAIPIFALLLGTFRRMLLSIKFSPNYNNSLLTALLLATIFHQCFEGYALAAGSYLCFFFWLVVGLAYSYKKYEHSK